jgi:hypothetical protein
MQKICKQKFYFHFIANGPNILFLTQQFKKSQMATMVEDELPIFFFSARVHGIALYSSKTNFLSYLVFMANLTLLITS